MATRNQRFNKREKTNINEKSLSVEATAMNRRFESAEAIDLIDETMGFPRFDQGPKKVGWLVNMKPTILKSDEVDGGLSAMDYYFLDEEGGSFKTTIQFDPYFLLSVKHGHEGDVEEFLKRKFESIVKNVQRVEREDLSLPNHLLGVRRKLVRVNFSNVTNLLAARRELMPVITANKSKQETADSYAEVSLSSLANNSDWSSGASKASHREALDFVQDIHEYDVPYHVRVAIDLDIRIGKWYKVEAEQGEVKLTVIPERVSRADPVVMAYDIETTKDPLKFPDSSKDKIMMISYMIDGQGYLITNREIVAEDIDDFEYTPKPEFPGIFTIFNEKDERDTITRFFEHIREEKPTVIATFNGDFFDWPFVDNRAKFHGVDMYQEIGFAKDSEDEYKSAYCAHMDCFRWVKRDSYLPQGSQGLKAVTTAKLGYNPLEIDPELMTPYAIEKPQVMAEYSVSDAVATYYLYMKYVHPFIFSLCNILPLDPDEVLRKGTGTLCEMLLMVQAYQGNILLPNKHAEPVERFYNGHLLESETYVGGHVESLEAGVFRSDIPAKFNVDTTAIDELMEQLDRALKFSIEVEAKKSLDDIENYDEVKGEIEAALLDLKTTPEREETPLIYHVDVASMYPNIMTTNRLQPDSMISEEVCASCDFNRPGKTCDRRLPWAWRGEFLPPKREEYLMIKNSLQNERFPGKGPYARKDDRGFDELSSAEQASTVKKRLTDYSRKVYHKIKETETINREAIICQRENPFYVNTVRSFRDRRYEFKGLQKVWKKKVDEIPSSDAAAKEEAKKMVVLYDSLQLAHKVILNSFYGYVMRKGSRWYSMEMAGVTCLTGATIIQLARSLVERLGRPLELDTDGIWCILPKSFPEDFTFKLKDGKKLPVSYPCVMMNHLVHEKFTNHQYQTLIDPKTFKYGTKSDNSIFFELDGPYKAMVLPTSKDEDKGLKKRYAVFNEDGTLAELKGFEIKRRGELQLIKTFQSSVFKEFLAGNSLKECYQAVAGVANIWLDVLETRGGKLQEEDMLEMISENRSMSKSLEEYGNQKSTSICTAKRLAEFLGANMVKDAGLACKYIISKKPEGSPVTDRAVPVAIFSAPHGDKAYFLRRWLKDPALDDFSPRAVIDWEYYKERLGATIQKIITVPAAYQGIENPVPRLPHPDWLVKRIAHHSDKNHQKTLTSFFKTATKEERVLTDASNRANKDVGDIEDFNKSPSPDPVGRVTAVKRKNKDGNEQENGAVAVTVRSEMPDPQEDYSAWLKVAKQKWAAQKQARQRRQHLFGSNTRARSSGLAGMIRNQNETAYSNTWNFLQFAPNDGSGQVRAFASINGKVQVVRINVRRTVYINFKNESAPLADLPNCTATRVNYTLPNGHSPNAMFKLEMDEQTYQDELSKPDSVLRHHHVEGIYEGQIDAQQRALLQLGNRCALDTSTRHGILGQGLESGFEMNWLNPQPGYEQLKLDYIHIIHFTSGNVQVFGVIPAWGEVGTVLVLRPSANAQKLPNMSNIYTTEYARIDSLKNNMFEYKPFMSFDEHYFDSISGLYRKLSALVSKYHSEKSTRAVVALQTENVERLKKHCRPLSELPVIQLRPLSVTLPSLNWQQAVAKWVIKTFLSLGKWLVHLSDLAAYANVPIGNLKHDDMSYLTDVIYARKLQQANIILWWSPEPIPDTGGTEKDNLLNSMDRLDLPTVNNPGLYSKVCLDLGIRNLSVNTILTAAIINEAEGVDLVGASDDIAPFIENSFSTPALAVLSSMVRDWWNEAAEENVHADMMVHNFIRWVSSPDSYLYDRKLYYHVQNLSKKGFIQLIKEFRKVGCQLVFADQNRALLLTSKTAVENTYAFANYLIKSIRSKSLFQYLDIEIREYWDLLLWMDDVNFSGQSCKDIGEGDVQLEVSLNWHVKKFLPDLLQQELEFWIVEFMENLKKARDEWYNPDRNGDGTRLTQISSTAMQRAGGEEGEEDENYMGKGLFRAMEPMVMKRMKHMLKLYNDSFENETTRVEFEMPLLAGSIDIDPHPVGLLIKILCAIFSLSKEMALEARLIRRHLLELVEIREFSAEATFKDPSSSLKLTQVICEHCKYVRDLDLCRHDDLAEQHGSVFTFSCEDCGRDYNRVAVEEMLVQQVMEMVTLYQTQDLKCAKCKRVREDDIQDHCKCSGSWIETMPKSDVDKQLRVYQWVGQYYGFKLLENFIGSV